MSEGNQLVAVIIEVTNLDRSEALYRNGFGLDLHRSDHQSDDRWIGGPHAAVSWETRGFLHFALYQVKTPEKTERVQLGFSVADLDQAHRAAVAAGATTVHGPRPQPWGRSARYRDFDDNVIELTQRT